MRSMEATALLIRMPTPWPRSLELENAVRIEQVL